MLTVKPPLVRNECIRGNNWVQLTYTHLARMVIFRANETNIGAKNYNSWQVSVFRIKNRFRFRVMNCVKSNNVLNDSGWRRAFGFFLNFSTLSSEDISAALEEYKSAFESGFAAKPNPKYKEKVFTPIEGYFPDCQYNDICYSLVNIFCNG